MTKVYLLRIFHQYISDADGATHVIGIYSSREAALAAARAEAQAYIESENKYNDEEDQLAIEDVYLDGLDLPDLAGSWLDIDELVVDETSSYFRY